MNIFGLSAKLFDVIIKTGLHISKCSFWRQFMEILISLLIFISAIYDYNFQLFRESFGGGVKTAFYMIREQFTAVCFFGEESLFCLFWTFTRKIWTSLWTSINNVAETICYVSKKKQTKQVCFCKLSFFMKIAEYELVKNGRLAELSPAGYSNLRFTCPENYFDGKQCFDKRISSKAIPESEREPVCLSGNLFNVVNETVFYNSNKSFEDCV